jgi:radical SAM superfamily enzyme YgiQ (UPF0313 family)
MAANGSEVLVKNMEVFEGGKYEGYAERADSFKTYTDALANNEHPVWVELSNLLDTLKPEALGISVLNVKYKSALKCIEIAESKGIPVIVGGTHPTIEPAKYPESVKVLAGEYETLGGRLLDLDNTPMPNYDILMDKYSPDGYGHIISARGCPFLCKFCASKTMWNRKVTFKSVDRLIDEMTYIHERFNTQYFTFWDETFTINKNRVREFCAKYRLPAKWRCDTRADAIDNNTVKMMKDSNCGQMSIGIESGDNETLQLIGKNETTDVFINAASILAKNNIQWKAYCIIGFPYDTEESILRSIEFIKALNPFRITINFFTPYKGTDLYDEVNALGMINETYSQSLFSHHSPHNYFCPKIPKERYMELKQIVSKDIDRYNERAIAIWK